jgi:uncharacterized membrane protein YidH (DUF202 family)
MKKIKSYLAGGSVAWLLPLLAFAQTTAGNNTFDADGGKLGKFLQDILQFINNVLIPFIIGIGFLLFVWGMFRYFIAGGANEEERNKGRDLMIWATIGFVLIIIFWGIVNIIAGSTGLSGNLETDLIPDAIQFPTDGPAAN